MQKLVKSGYSVDMSTADETPIAGAGRPPKATTAAIVQAAWALFEEVGFDAASMTAIADRAGVSRRTLFNYFPHKADLLFHGWDDFMQQFRDELLTQPKDLPLFAALTNTFWSLAPCVEELEARFHPGPAVTAARVRDENVAYWKSLWGRQMEQLVLDIYGPEYRMKAGFVGAIAAQAWAEFIALQHASALPISHNEAMAKVLGELADVLGAPLLAARLVEHAIDVPLHRPSL